MDSEAIKDLLTNVTPGPWWSDDRPDGAIIWTSGENRVCFMAHSNGLNPERDIANARFIADAQAALTAIERAAYERGVRDALTEAIKEAKGSVTISGQRFLTAKLDDLEPAFLALLTQEGR